MSAVNTENLKSIPAFELGPVINMPENDHFILSNYYKALKEFNKKLCRPGTEQKFNKLYKNFRGDGIFIPVLSSGVLDSGTIKKNLPILEKKKNWIQSLHKRVKGIKKFDGPVTIVQKLNLKITQLLELKYRYDQAKDTQYKETVKRESELVYSDLKKLFQILVDKVPYLVGFDFPVDHFELRKKYDRFKIFDDDANKKISNDVYFFRKIVEDGAQNKNASKSDRFLRTAINTTYLLIQRDGPILSEDLRFNLDWVLPRIERIITRGKKYQLRRLKEWEGRTERAISFYQDILNGKVKVGDHYESGEKYLKEKAKARYILKDWSLQRMASVYEFWSHKSELMRSLYVMETILFNEVGRVEKGETVERSDVLQVVINRYFNPKYNYLGEADPIYPYLSDDTKFKLKNYRWLNVLLREGEFSFSYFFIHANVRIFCPDMSRAGRKLRHENLTLSLGKLKRPDAYFKGLRYFSRASMLGLIDMKPLWKDYFMIPERVGKKAKRQKVLQRYLKKKKYSYRYSFTDPNSRDYEVLIIKDRPYSYRRSDNTFFNYRSPHLFRYFRQKD